MTAEDRAARGMTPRLTLLFAVAGGVAVGNLYWAQPLLAGIARGFGVPPGVAGLLVTVTQVGYALGILLVVPLGDVVERRRLVPAVMGCSAVALAAAALAPAFGVLLGVLTAVGLTTVAGQLLTPLAGDLAHDGQRGRVLGAVASGLLTGILVSRTLSGLVAGLVGWRGVYAAAAAGTAVLALLLARTLPAVPPRAAGPGGRPAYGALLASVVTVVRRHRSVQVTMVLGATQFAVFTMFWTGLTLLLSAPPFSYPVSRIGLVGLAGLAGALAAQRAGRLHDRGWSVPATGAGLGLAVLSLLLAALGGRSIAVVLVAVVLFDVAVQAVNVLNQTRLLSVDPSARSRLNTAFVTGNFAGGAVGSALAAGLWQLGGWPALTLGGAALMASAVGVWLGQRRRALAVV